MTHALGKYAMFVSVLLVIVGGMNIVVDSAWGQDVVGGKEQSVVGPRNNDDPVGSRNDFPTFPNPFNSTSLKCLIYEMVTIFVNVMAVVAALYIIYAGFKFIAAQGNQQKLIEARRTFLSAIIGTAIILGAWVIVQFVTNSVGEITGGTIGGEVLDGNSCKKTE